ARLLKPVVEKVVAFLQRLLVRRALLPAPTVDVEIREDTKQPGPEIRARREGAPAAERPRIGLLDEVLSLLACRDEAPGNAIDLAGVLERLLLEAHTVTGVRSQTPRLAFARRLAHPDKLPTKWGNPLVPPRAPSSVAVTLPAG